MPIVDDAACSLILPDWSRSICEVRSIRFAGRRVERGDLVEHELLVGQRLGDDDRGPQRGDRRRRRPVDALDQLEVVLADSSSAR